ncbi:Fungal specific transcription factor [Myotisia sp. PD_48]|nr:Fungal specific transcription factor [Myotisia sp. PD_48]
MATTATVKSSQPSQSQSISSPATVSPIRSPILTSLASSSNPPSAPCDPSPHTKHAAPVPCDACYQGKTRCEINQAVDRCFSCDFHRRDCSFTIGSQLGKRKSDDANGAQTKAQATDTSSPKSPVSDAMELSSEASLRTTTQHIGMTSELEPLMLDFLPFDWKGEAQLATTRIRKFSDDETFMKITPDISSTLVSLETVENLVTPFGPTLVDKYFRRLHSSFPILLEDDFRSAHQLQRAISPLLLGSVFLVSLKWLEPEPGIQTLRRPDAARLEALVCRLLSDSLSNPSIPTLQAGLLLSQRSHLFTPRLMAQLVTAGFDLGLHQDCSLWHMDNREKALRKRLAWALYKQDKWCALVYGRPSHIFSSNWTVTELSVDDFENNTHSSSSSQAANILPSPHSSTPPPPPPPPPSAAVGRTYGSHVFRQYVTLTRILSDILDSFYTLEAMREFSDAGAQRTHLILARAKPLQIQLKDWFARLPAELKVDPGCTEEAGANGGLHLAYFAIEITLHRYIIRSIIPDITDPYLIHICRSAAKTRLISAMDFVNRLRPTHLRAFWPAASRTNFALVSAFGILLQITAQTQQEEEFYNARLREYRWTLSVSRKDAEFLDFAIENLDNMTPLLEGVPRKPEIEEFMAKSTSLPVPPPPSEGRYDDLRHESTNSQGYDRSSRDATVADGYGYYDSDESEEERCGSSETNLRPDSSSAASRLPSPGASVLSGGSSIEPRFANVYASGAHR